MATTREQTPTIHSVTLRRTFAVPRDRVFRAWTEPEQMQLWSGPGPMLNTMVEVDLRVGGRYRIQMQGPDGKEYRAVGTYRLVDPPRKLVYTWLWETDPTPNETIVTVEFRERDKSTELILTHDLFLSDEQRKGHEDGWNGCLEKFATVISSEYKERRP